MGIITNWFLPHHGNNHKANLLRFTSLGFLSFLFIASQIGLNFFTLVKPAVLGFSANITPEAIIDLTNKQREKLGLSDLKENPVLSEAARQKAADMFAFNYWSHISPSGRTPWTFFTDAGYRYQYAGENLARDFQDPDAVVKAWMGSPTHRDNIANSKYQEIGVSVVDGTLQGVETALVVQLFGTPYGAPIANTPAKPAIDTAPAPETEQLPNRSSQVLSAPQSNPFTSPFDLTKAVVIFVVGLLMGVFLVDLLLVPHHTPRFSSRSLAQFVFLGFILFIAFSVEKGAILTGLKTVLVLR